MLDGVYGILAGSLSADGEEEIPESLDWMCRTPSGSEGESDH